MKVRLALDEVKNNYKRTNQNLYKQKIKANIEDDLRTYDLTIRFTIPRKKKKKNNRNYKKRYMSRKTNKDIQIMSDMTA